MSENETDHPADPINQEAADWEEAALPAQEDSSEDQILPLPEEDPAMMGEQGSTGTEREAGEPHDIAFARDRPDTSGATGSAAPSGQPEQEPERDENAEGMRLVEEDQGVREDDERTMVAEDPGEDHRAYTAEEQAVHEERE